MLLSLQNNAELCSAQNSGLKWSHNKCFDHTASMMSCQTWCPQENRIGLHCTQRETEQSISCEVLETEETPHRPLRATAATPPLLSPTGVSDILSCSEKTNLTSAAVNLDSLVFFFQGQLQFHIPGEFGWNVFGARKRNWTVQTTN